MLSESAVNTAKQRIEALMKERARDFADRSGRIIGDAARSGLINAPHVHEEVFALVWQEYLARSALCTDVLCALACEDGCEAAKVTGAELRALAAEILAASVDDLAKVHGAFSQLAGARADHVTFEQCQQDAAAQAAARIDVAIEGVAERV